LHFRDFHDIIFDGEIILLEDKLVEKYFNKMKEYLNMDAEIPLDEFENYYKELIDNLKENFEGQSVEDHNKGYFILLNLGSNALDRAKRKGPNTKKYKKIAEKSQFWAEAISAKLKGLGMTEEEINQKYDEIYEGI
jgi:hypothetical protein